MSWLYSIVFAGLMISSSGEVPGDSCSLPEAPALRAAQGDERERFEQSYPLSATGRVSVSNVNGSIVVEAWDRNEVKLEAVKIADTREALAEVELKIDARADSFSVEADHSAWKRVERGTKNYRRLEVQFKLSVPRTAMLNDIETVNGSVNVANFVNLVKASAVNGNVVALNLRGAAHLSTVNGEVNADFDRLESGSKISLDTVNGKVNLTLPSDANATLRADSLNGEIRNDFGLPVRKGKYVGRDMYGRLGSGDVQVRLESVNGPLVVQKKNDGRPQSPAVDLLPQKPKDGDDWDSHTSWTPTTAKVNRDIAKAVRDAARNSTAGVEIAQAELARIQPEIEKIRAESLDKVKSVDKTRIDAAVKQSLSPQIESLARMRNVRWSGGSTFIEKKSNTFPVKGTPKVTIEGKGASVKVKGWDRQEVKYVLTELDSRAGAIPVSVVENATDSAVTLRVNNAERASRDIYFNGANDSIRIEVFVPRKTNMKIVSNGEIRVDGVAGEMELNGVDESIDVRDVEGKLKISAVDGRIRVIGFAGEVESRTGDGDVFLEGNFTRITGVSRDGSFVVTIPEQYNADVVSNVGSLNVEDLTAPQLVKEGMWRFGSGGPKFSFTVVDGEVRFRNSNSLTNSR
jgi:DUF4097 and DUF4098 domain-containing protein YvlB